MDSTPQAQPANPYAPPPAQEPAAVNPYAAPTTNPYAMPGAAGGFAGGSDTAEAIRREHLSHEASLRSFGSLYWFSGFLALGLAAIAVLFGLYLAVAGDPSSAFAIVVGGLLYGALGWLNVWLGRGLRDTDPKVKTVMTVFGVIGLLGFPLGTLISLYLLYLLHSAKGKVVLSREYQAIRAATPHIQYKTPLWVWIVVGLAVLGFVVAIVMAVSS